MKQDYKEILSAYRVGTADEEDKIFQEALLEIECDPELKGWFDHQVEMDSAIRDALRTEEAPPELLEDVLEFGASAQQKNNVLVKFLRPAPILTTAACLLLAFVFAFKDSIINNQIIGYHAALSEVEKQNSFREAMSLWVADTFIVLDHFDEKPAQLASYLAGMGSPVYTTIPGTLEELPTLGCKSFQWQDQTVSLICFHSPEEKIVHLFILEPKEAPREDVENLRELKFLHELPSKGWYSEPENKQYMLVGSDSDVSLDRFNTELI